MSIGTRVLKDAANEANPNKVPQVMRNRMGDLMNSSLRYFRGTVTANRLVLPAGAKAAALLNGVIVAATGGTGPIDPQAEDVTLGAGEAAVAMNGDIAFFATDAVTEAEVWYLAYGAAPVSMSIVVDPATGLGAFNPHEAVRLISANATAGTVTGVAAVALRSDAQPTGSAIVNLNLDGANVEFLIADAVTAADVVFIPRPGFGPDADTVAGQMQAPVTAL